MNARHRRQSCRPVEPTAARRDTPTCCGTNPTRVVCHCGNAYACQRCGAELHGAHSEEG